ncbi:hypothetical protein ABZP36_027125 [Zizania latifolia]
MVLPLVKLGSLAFRTLSKPIAALLKHNAGTPQVPRVHHRPPPRAFTFCHAELTIAMILVAGAAIIYEVQRSASAGARKEDIRRQEIESEIEQCERRPSFRLSPLPPRRRRPRQHGLMLSYSTGAVHGWLS